MTKPYDDGLLARNASLRNDACSYRHKVAESLGVYKYMMDPIFNENPDRCFPSSSTVRLGKFGTSTCDAAERIDLDSEIRLGLTRKLTKCPSSQLSEREEKLCALTLPSSCNRLGTEYNRLINPPCTLRGSSKDLISARMSTKFMIPCVVEDQKRSTERPFANNVSNRILAKDMHRPCVATFAYSSKSAGSKAAEIVPAGTSRRYRPRDAFAMAQGCVGGVDVTGLGES